MRLFLLPISTRRTLIYCQKSNNKGTKAPTITERISQKAAQTWAEWEKRESGWQKRITEYGNKALQKISYEEWALKNISFSLTSKDGKGQKDKVEVIYPSQVFKRREVLERVHVLGTERASIHKSRLTYSIIGMPITIPFMLIPVIPNIPFFYLVYRAFSHWHALTGSKHLRFLFQKDLLLPVDSPILNQVYSQFARSNPLNGKSGVNSEGGSDRMLLTDSAARQIAKSLAIPELVVELERAVWQVSTSIAEAEVAEARKRM